MLMQYFQSRTPGCTPRPSSWILHRYQLTILILIITILILIITIICWGVIRCWAPGCAFRLYSLSLVHAVRKVVLTLPRRNRPGPKPCYRLVDPPACSAVTVETKVFFYCANPRKNVDTKRLLYRFGRKPGSDC